MNITNSTLNDTENIQSLYDQAIAYQKEKKGLPWPVIRSTLIQAEIRENRQWKLVINNQIICVWMTTFNDHEIWKEKNSDPSVYIHRIAMHPEFRGQNIMSKIFDWAKQFAFQNHKEYLRLDIASINPGLITTYVRNGFKFIGINKMETPKNLPSHYHNTSVCLLEMKLNKDVKECLT